MQPPQPQGNPGMSPAVLQAIQRRGAPAPALSQASPGAAMANPVMPPSNPSDLNKASAPQQAPKPKFQPQDRKDLIVSALVEQLKLDNKFDKEKAAISPQPSPQEAPAAPQPMAMGGGNPGFSLSPGFEQPTSPMQMQSDYMDMSKDYSGLNNYGKGGGIGRY